MATEEKELLLQDLCARLPYGVKCISGVDDKTLLIKGINPNCCGASEIQVTYEDSGINFDTTISSIKPYLFPLTEEILDKATEESNKLYRELICIDSIYKENNDVKVLQLQAQLKSSVIKYFHIHHIDYNGLIEKGLALDSTGLNIY